ncbi:hypothetical protein F4825DRAFT_447178 [Nemania diffusa]|nr:hypothetical protein F4825DRAFT_447178 [Nemania diffusa]
MSEVVEFVDWGDDFRYAEEWQRVTEIIQKIGGERGFSHAIAQQMLIKNRYRTMVGLQLTVHFKKREWVEQKTARYVLARIHFTEDCTLQDMEGNPEWHPEVKAASAAV